MTAMLLVAFESVQKMFGVFGISLVIAIIFMLVLNRFKPDK